MNNRIAISLIGILFALAMATWAYAAQTATKSEIGKPGEPWMKAQASMPNQTGSKPEVKREEGKKSAAPKMIHYRAGGIVTAMDAAAGKITLKQDQVYRERTLKLMEDPKKAAKAMKGLRVGDAVNVWVRGNTITQLVKVF
jgi:Cu/Ag efflux protein CusF